MTNQQHAILIKLANEISLNSNIYINLNDSLLNNKKFIKKFSNAKKSFELDISINDTLILHDDTLFGSSKEGFILTWDTIYWKESFQKYSLSKSLNDNINVEYLSDGKFKIGSTIINMSLLQEQTENFVEFVRNLIKFNTENNEIYLDTPSPTFETNNVLDDIDNYKMEYDWIDRNSIYLKSFYKQMINSDSLDPSVLDFNNFTKIIALFHDADKENFKIIYSNAITEE